MPDMGETPFKDAVRNICQRLVHRGKACQNAIRFCRREKVMPVDGGKHSSSVGTMKPRSMDQGSASSWERGTRRCDADVTGRSLGERTVGEVDRWRAI